MQMLGKQMGKKKSFISLYSQNPDQKSEKTAAVDRETENVLEEMRLEKKGTIDGCKQLASVIYDSAHECHWWMPMSRPTYKALTGRNHNDPIISISLEAHWGISGTTLSTPQSAGRMEKVWRDQTSRDASSELNGFIV